MSRSLSYASEAEVSPTVRREDRARRPTWSRHGLGWGTLLGFALAIALVVATGVVAASELRRTDVAGNLARQTFEVLDQIDAVLRHLLDAETGQRGYLLTGSPNYLEPYQRATRDLAGDLERLRTSIAGDAEQRARLDELEPMIDAKLSELESSVHLRDLEGPEAALEVVNTDYGRRVMEAVRGKLTDIHDAEQRLLASRLATREEASRRATAFVILGSVLTVLILGGATIALERSTRRRLHSDRGFSDVTERLRVTLRSIADAVIATDAEGRVAFANPVAQALTGWPEDEARGRPLAEVLRIVGAEGGRPAEDPDERVIRAGTLVARSSDAILVSRDGSEIPIDESGAPIRDSDGEVMGVVLVFRDASERRRAEAERERALRAEVEKAVTASALRRTDAERGLLQAILDAAPIGLGFFDADCRFVRVNRALADLDGVPVEAHVGRTVGEVLPRMQPRVADDLGRVLHSGEPIFGAEVAGESPAAPGAHRTWRASYVPVRGHDGAVLGVAAVIEDVTDRRRAEIDREQLYRVAELARREAEAANRAKDEFLAIVSHELRSPLSAMAGWIRILASRCVGDETVDRALKTLDRNIRVQAQIISDLLDVSRFLSGKLALESRAVSLSANLEASVESMRPIAADRGVTLECDIPPGALHVRGDPQRLAQIFTNLLNNAVKFTQPGGIIRMSLSRDGDGTACVRVADTGVGIERGLLPHVFERFRQGESSGARTHGGLGLGLAIVKHLVEMHGGSVHASSEGVGKGATFTVRLPVAAHGAVEAEGQPAVAVLASAGGLAGVRVLLVEDDADSREALELLLEDQGMTVTSAASFDEAVAAFHRARPDIVLSDIGILGGSGYDLIRRIRESEDMTGRRVLAVAMTGFAGKQDHEEALRAGFDEHLRKPIDVDALLERIGVLAAALPGRHFA